MAADGCVSYSTVVYIQCENEVTRDEVLVGFITYSNFRFLKHFLANRM